MESTSLKVALETLLASVGIVIANSIVILLALFDVVREDDPFFLRVCTNCVQTMCPNRVSKTRSSWVCLPSWACPRRRRSSRSLERC